MRLLAMSDLHQGEYGPPFDPAQITAPFDVVVIAGDCAGRLTHSLTWISERFPGIPVIYVPGNHDFYRDGGPDGFTYEDECEAGRDLAQRLDIHLLMRDAVVIDGWRFLGTTLWTDMMSPHHHGMSSAIGDAQRRMNDYRRIHRRSTVKRSRRIRPEFTIALHKADREFLRDRLSSSDRDRTVVVTHHAPSWRSLPNKHDTLNHCYASHLDLLIESQGPAVWLHGHSHRAVDYRIGQTRILCNPLGYAGEETGFDPCSVSSLTEP